MEIKAPSYDSPRLDFCGNTTMAMLEHNGLSIALCSECLESLTESLKAYNNTIFCYKCDNFIMSKSGWEYGGSCLKNLKDKSTFDPNDAGYVKFKACVETCDDAVLKNSKKDE